MSLSGIKFLFSKLTESIIINSITLSGGEPLLYKKLINLAEFLSQKTAGISLSTNAVLLKKKLIPDLIRSGISHYEISLDSLKSEIYKKITGKNHLKKVLNNIFEARSLTRNISISMQLNALNMREAYDIINLCRALLIKHLNLYIFMPAGIGIKHKKMLFLNFGDIMEILRTINGLNKNKDLTITVFGYPYKTFSSTDNFNNLNFGICADNEKFILDPYGNIRRCDINPVIYGNPVNKNINKILNLIDNCQCPAKIQ